MDLITLTLAKNYTDSVAISGGGTSVTTSTTNGNIKINGAESIVYTHPSGTNPHSTTKSDVGLSNVDNTSDIDKPVSTIQATAIGLKVDKVAGSSLVADVNITKITTNETNITDITTQLTVAEATNVYTLDLAIKKSFTIDITNATAKTITLTNIPSDLDFAKPVTIKVICSIGNTISTYPTGVVWVDGVVPIYTIGKTYYLTLMRIANGWHGACLGAF